MAAVDGRFEGQAEGKKEGIADGKVDGTIEGSLVCGCGLFVTGLFVGTRGDGDEVVGRGIDGASETEGSEVGFIDSEGAKVGVKVV